jgi:hypothetical protein
MFVTEDGTLAKQDVAKLLAMNVPTPSALLTRPL